MLENIRLSIQGIFAHKIRSLLTMLGIIIGIAAIIAIVSTIRGTNEQIKSNLVGAGNNTVAVALYQGEYEYDMQYQAPPSGVPVISSQVKAQLSAIKEVESVALYRTRNYCDSIFYQNTKLEGGSIWGIDADYFQTAGYQIQSGKGFRSEDYAKGNNVAILDTDSAQSLFAGENPVGKVIDINGMPFKVVGVAVQSSAFEPVIQSIDDYHLYASSSVGKVFLPDAAWPIVFRYDEPQNCLLKTTETDAMTKVGKQASDLLNARVTTSGTGETIQYKSRDLLEQAKSLQELSSSTNTMLIYIAGISLLVGGIGVMNIMLVSVTERTREIGLKKALGAKKRHILFQFLTEAAVLTSVGGLLGVVAGIGLSRIIARLAEVPVAISPVAAAVAVLFSMIVGILFGWIPSIKAANLNPIDALRYE